MRKRIFRLMIVCFCMVWLAVGATAQQSIDELEKKEIEIVEQLKEQDRKGGEFDPDTPEGKELRRKVRALNAKLEQVHAEKRQLAQQRAHIQELEMAIGKFERELVILKREQPDSPRTKEIEDKLTLQYNRARQANITQELMEIVGGAEALNG